MGYCPIGNIYPCFRLGSPGRFRNIAPSTISPPVGRRLQALSNCRRVQRNSCEMGWRWFLSHHSLIALWRLGKGLRQDIRSRRYHCPWWYHTAWYGHRASSSPRWRRDIRHRCSACSEVYSKGLGYCSLRARPRGIRSISWLQSHRCRLLSQAIGPAFLWKLHYGRLRIVQGLFLPTKAASHRGRGGRFPYWRYPGPSYTHDGWWSSHVWPSARSVWWSVLLFDCLPGYPSLIMIVYDWDIESSWIGKEAVMIR